MGELETDLLNWAEGLQMWQRDLLRRLAQGELLCAVDYRNYADESERIELTKPAPWAFAPNLSESPKYLPIDASHLQVTASGSPPVSVNKITHLEGANDLAPGATVEFASSGLTIVAGRNGSGKSGYTRILKQVAVSRGPEKVLPNAFNPVVVPKAVITYRVGESMTQDLTWQSDIPLENSPLQRVRVFDAKSAAVQLATSAEVAYIPPTLQVLADYTSAIKTIGELIDDDLQRANLSKRSWPSMQTNIGLEVFEHLGEKSGLEALYRFTTLSDKETMELAEIPAKLQILIISDPARMAIQARSRAGQLSALARNLKNLASGLSVARVDESLKNRQRVLAAENLIEEASKQIQQDVILPETGSPKWRTMWLAAKEFIEDTLDHEFPDLTDGAVCALCQQPLENTARSRFERFSEFMKGEAQTELREALRVRQDDIAALKALSIESIVTKDLVDLVSTYNKITGETLLPLIARATALVYWLIAPNPIEDAPEDAKRLAIDLQEVINSLNKPVSEENIAADKFGSSDSNALEASMLQARKQELELRQQLAATKTEIEIQHDLVIRTNRLKVAAKSCDTTAASKENTKLSKEYVEKVCATFATEANKLGLDRVPIELIFDKSTRGVSYIKVSLMGAPAISVPTVLSEGEQRIAAIAGFFADLTESGDDSTLVFDDPVSSLDQSYREAVARRLLIEAEKRQVLVFTHDFTFVQYLYEQHKLLKKSVASQQATDEMADVEYVHIARCPNGAGEPTSAEQWRHVSIKERIGRINTRIQNVGVLYRANDDVAYEKEARDIVGAIRETWEYFVEQELLNGIVQRHERAVQTQRLKNVVDICEVDVAVIEEGMSISSRWLTGHTAPVTDATQVIKPDQLKDEMKKFTDFRAEVLNRRKGK